jgi:DNA replication and repair protein RecF
MRIETLRLKDFRAHTESRLSFAPKVNLIVGPNGAGKTNILEAIHYLCLSKSFLASQDGYVLRKGAPFFEVEGHLEGRQRAEADARLVFVPKEGKRIFINGAPLERLAQVVGLLPVVVFSPGDQALTAGGPDERRRFLDNILSQARPVYLDDLLKYRRALRQRNELLSQYRRMPGQMPEGVMASWNAEVVALGSRVIHSRLRFMRVFARFLEEAYRHIEAAAERPTMAYSGLTTFDYSTDEEAIVRAYWDAFSRVERRERELGRTMVGPHRDEIIFKLNGMAVRPYASQGQHRTFGMALKLAQYLYLHDQLDEPPMLLLDDVFDNLDPIRSAAFLNLLQTDVIGQSIITAARRTPFQDDVPFDQPENRVTEVKAGQIIGAAP